MKPTIYVVGDDPGAGANPDSYGHFSTRENAQSWIDRQRARGYPWADSLVIREYLIDVARDLGSRTP